MKYREVIRFPHLVLFLALGSVASASTTWYVNGVSGNDSNNCLSAQTACKTIGHAISLAASGDSIRVASATYPENLTIGFSLNVIGAGASTTIMGSNYLSSVVAISNASADVALSNLTISKGVAFLQGGGILNWGTLTINNATISGNEAFNNCEVIRAFCVQTSGGGIYNGGTLTINNSTISGNSAVVTCRVWYSCGGTQAFGGGIYNRGTLMVNNSTISGNSAFAGCGTSSSCIGLAKGGGILNASTLEINNGTIGGNSVGCSGQHCSISGGGVSGGAILKNSIVANNTGGNCSGVYSNGYNISSDSSCNFSDVGDLNNTDPKLGTLGSNGGPTQTIPLLSGSPAIDAGNPNGCTDNQGSLLKTDQRGMPRPDKEDSAGCDMGAFENQSD